MEFYDSQDAEDASSLDGGELNGKRIRVDFYKKISKTPRVTVTINGRDYANLGNK